VDLKARAAQWGPADLKEFKGHAGLEGNVAQPGRAGHRVGVVLRVCKAVAALRVGADLKARAVRWVHAGQRASADQWAHAAHRVRVVRSGLGSGKTLFTL